MLISPIGKDRFTFFFKNSDSLLLFFSFLSQYIIFVLEVLDDIDWSK